MEVLIAILVAIFICIYPWGKPKSQDIVRHTNLYVGPVKQAKPCYRCGGKAVFEYFIDGVMFVCCSNDCNPGHTYSLPYWNQKYEESLTTESKEE